MSRATVLDAMYAKHRKGALSFDYESLSAPSIFSIFALQDVQSIYKIATNPRLTARMDKKKALIAEIMNKYGFRQTHSGTNRVVYECTLFPYMVVKIAVDSVGINDNPAEYKNQQYFKPFCCKIFEVDPSGVMAFIEKVNPISSKNEFLSVANDIYSMLITKIIGKFIVSDLGSNSYMNFGVRQLSNGATFGPVVIDFPYVYKLDANKIICNRRLPDGSICGGEIDYDAGLNYLQCKKCGKTYTAMDLQKKDSGMLFFGGKRKEQISMRVQIVRADGTVLLDSGKKSDSYVDNKTFKDCTGEALEPGKVYTIDNFVKKKYIPLEEKRRQFYFEMQKAIESQNDINEAIEGSNNKRIRVNSIDGKPVGKPMPKKAVVGGGIKFPKDIRDYAVRYKISSKAIIEKYHELNDDWDAFRKIAKEFAKTAPKMNRRALERLGIPKPEIPPVEEKPEVKQGGFGIKFKSASDAEEIKEEEINNVVETPEVIEESKETPSISVNDNDTFGIPMKELTNFDNVTSIELENNTDNSNNEVLDTPVVTDENSPS